MIKKNLELLKIAELKNLCKEFQLRNYEHIINKKDLINFINLNLVVSSKYQTLQWRKENISKKLGQKDGKCEKYQKLRIEFLTEKPLLTSKGTRINMRTLEMKENRYSMTKNKKIQFDGFDWSEDFDGKQEYFNNQGCYKNVFFYNLKFVVDSGGSQTRTLKNVYSFVEAQLKYLQKNKNTKKVFVNILDGCYSFEKISHFRQHLFLYYPDVKERCFVGDLHEFQDWFDKFNK